MQNITMESLISEGHFMLFHSYLENKKQMYYRPGRKFAFQYMVGLTSRRNFDQPT